jgi:hypothetical protein
MSLRDGRRAGAPALALAVLVAAACDDAPTTLRHVRREEPWVFAQTTVAAGMFVDVRGRPFAESRERTATRVAEIMRSAVTWTATARFVTDPAKAVDARTRVVLVFNGAGSGDAACGAAAEGGAAAADGRLRVAATFCDGDTMISGVDGQIGRLSDPEDARFSALIRQVTIDLFAGERRP